MPAEQNSQLDHKKQIIEVLHKEGFVDQLKAQVRARIVQQLEQEKKKQLGSAAKYIKPLSLSTTRKVVSNNDGLLCAELIREFFQFYKMEHTLSVFIPEMSLHAEFPKSREEMLNECGFQKSQDDISKPLILQIIEKFRIGDYNIPLQQSGKKNSPGTDEFSNSPNQMRPNFIQQQHNQDNIFVDHTPPATGIQNSGEAENSRKNTRNKKQKQSKQENNIKPRKGAPFDNSNSSEKKNQGMSNLGDLPGFKNHNVPQVNDNDFNFDELDEFDNAGKEDDDSEHFRDQNQNNMSKYSNAERYLDDFENEQKDGFKVEVKRPQAHQKNKIMPNSSGKKNRKAFSSKFGQANDYDVEVENMENDEEIEEEIQTEREKESAGGHYDMKIESSLGHQAGITVSQSLGIDPSVDSLALDEYDHIEVVEI